MKIRLDINFVKGKPVLVGCALHPFGWLLGGSVSGELSITCDVDLDLPGVAEKASDELLFKKFKKAVKNFDYYKNGHKMLMVEHYNR